MSRKQTQTITRASQRLQPALAILSQLRAALVRKDLAGAEQLAGELAERLLDVEDLVGVSTPPSLFDGPACPLDDDTPRLAGSTADELWARAKEAGRRGTLLGLPIESADVDEQLDSIDHYSCADLIALLNRLATENHADRLTAGETWDFGEADVRAFRNWMLEDVEDLNDVETAAACWLATQADLDS